MKLFKIFERFSSSKKLPSKDFLYKEFYRRTEKPQWFHSKKFYNENYERLNKIEIDNIKNLIDNYPNASTYNIEKISDFTLDCIIPETLYKVRASNKEFGDIGLVFIKDNRLQLYYSNTRLWNINTHSSDRNFKDRIQIKKEILEHITRNIK